MTNELLPYVNIRIQQVTRIIDEAVKAHTHYLPMIGHAAWDFALNESNQPLLIEVNLGWPRIMLEQLSNHKSVYGDRTLEVIEYCSKHQNNTKWQDFNESWL